MENDTLAFMQQRIKVVPKKVNTPCIASLRPLEDFWVALKKAVYDGVHAKNSFGRQPHFGLYISYYTALNFYGCMIVGA